VVFLARAGKFGIQHTCWGVWTQSTAGGRSEKGGGRVCLGKEKGPLNPGEGGRKRKKEKDGLVEKFDFGNTFRGRLQARERGPHSVGVSAAQGQIGGVCSEVGLGNSSGGVGAVFDRGE